MAITQAPTGIEPRVMTRRDEWAVVAFGGWMVIGLFLDGWAHNMGKPESFFSPWHGVLYSGFAAAMAYTAYDRRSRGVGMERSMLAGVLLFAAGGLGDMVWHEIFGIEEDVAALLSPTHLALMVGGLLMLTAPVRSAREDLTRRDLPGAVLVGLTLSSAVASFFTMYASAFHVEPSALRSASEDVQVHGVVSVLVTNALLVGPMLLALRRWRPRAGSFTFMFAAVALLLAGIEAFEPLPLVAAAAAGGLAADLLAPRSVRLTAGLAPVVLWSAYFAVAAAAWGLGWPVEIWTGAIVLAGLSGWGLYLLTLERADAVA